MDDREFYRGSTGKQKAIFIFLRFVWGPGSVGDDSRGPDRVEGVDPSLICALFFLICLHDELDESLAGLRTSH